MKYFEDPALKVLHAGQSGSFPYPDEDRLRQDRQLSETREGLERLRKQLNEVRSAGGPARSSISARQDTPLEPNGRGRSVRRVVGREVMPLRLELSRLGIIKTDETVLASAVQTTRSIIKEYT